MYNNYPDQTGYPDAYKIAEERVKAKLGFYWHLAAYLAVNAMIFAIWFISGLSANYFGNPWFLWPLAGWGVGLVMHFLGVFVIVDTPETRRRMLQKELDRMGYSQPAGPGAPAFPSDYTVNPAGQEENQPEPAGRR